MKDKDANCRLRHGLNFFCLAKVSQHLDGAELYTVGRMNEFYKGIIREGWANEG